MMENNRKMTSGSLDLEQALQELGASTPDGLVDVGEVIEVVGNILRGAEGISSAGTIKLLREIVTKLKILGGDPDEDSRYQREIIVEAIESFLAKRGQLYLSPEDRRDAEAVAEEEVPLSEREVERRRTLYRQ